MIGESGHDLFVRLERSLTNQTPDAEQIGRIEALRSSAKRFAADLSSYAGSGRERALAATHLEESVMWAVKSIVLEEE